MCQSFFMSENQLQQVFFKGHGWAQDRWRRRVVKHTRTRAHTPHYSTPGRGGFSLTCRCNKAGFHGDCRGWHGDGVTDPEIKHDNEPCLGVFFPLSLSPLLSNSLKFPQVKNKTLKLDKCLKDSKQYAATHPVFLLFFVPTCLTGLVAGSLHVSG